MAKHSTNFTSEDRVISPQVAKIYQNPTAQIWSGTAVPRFGLLFYNCSWRWQLASRTNQNLRDSKFSGFPNTIVCNFSGVHQILLTNWFQTLTSLWESIFQTVSSPCLASIDDAFHSCELPQGWSTALLSTSSSSRSSHCRDVRSAASPAQGAGPTNPGVGTRRWHRQKEVPQMKVLNLLLKLAKNCSQSFPPNNQPAVEKRD